MKPSHKPPGKSASESNNLQKNLRTDWGDVAGWYDTLVGESGSEYQQQVVFPGVLRLLAPVAGQQVVDIACGQGVFCRALHGRGVEVSGIDAAAELIRVARERGPADIRYQQGDAQKLGFLPADRFDSATCILAIQNMHPLPPVVAGVARLLKSGGRFVIAMMHPCFRGAKQTSWGWDDENKIQYRRVDRYLIPRKTPIITHPGSAPDQYTWTMDRPISAYVKAMRQAGLLVDAIEEWPSHKTSNSGPRAAAENISRREIPMFLAIRALKIAGISNDDQTDELPQGAGGESREENGR